MNPAAIARAIAEAFAKTAAVMETKTAAPVPRIASPNAAMGVALEMKTAAHAPRIATATVARPEPKNWKTVEAVARKLKTATTRVIGDPLVRAWTAVGMDVAVITRAAIYAPKIAGAKIRTSATCVIVMHPMRAKDFVPKRP